MDIFDARVVHATVAACRGVQRALEDRAEDRRADLAPVEAAAFFEDEAARRLVDRRDRHVLGEQAAVDVRERGEFRVEEAVARVFFLVEHMKQRLQTKPEIFGAERLHAALECIVRAKQPRVLGVKAKDEAHAEDVEGGGFLLRVLFHCRRDAGRYVASGKRQVLFISQYWTCFKFDQLTYHYLPVLSGHL